MNNIAIITARSGSKGLKDKNIKLLNGKPLLVYSVETALQSNMFVRVMVSTDSYEYASLAKSYGAEVPFLRSKDTSGDKSGSWEAVHEVLDKYLELGEKYDTICLLQPTSPLRTSSDIISAYDFLNKTDADAITSVCLCDHPKEYMIELPSDKSLEKYRQNCNNKPRQQLPICYRLNGAIYIRRIEYKNDTVYLLNSREYAYIMDRINSVDIDSIEDFMYAEYLLKHYMK